MSIREVWCGKNEDTPFLERESQTEVYVMEKRGTAAVGTLAEMGDASETELLDIHERGDSRDLGLEPPPPKGRFRTPAKFLLVGACCVALLCMICVSFGGGNVVDGKEAVEVHEVIMYDDDDDDTVISGESADDLPKCAGKTQWRRIVLADFRVPTALNMSFRLASMKRVKCDPPMVPLAWDINMFINDKYRDFEVVVMHKFAKDCKGESFLLHFVVHGDPETKFDMEVHHNLKTQLWTLLGTDPGACSLLADPGTSSQPRIVSPGSEEVKTAAQFAISELNFKARENSCIDLDVPIKLGGIHSATVQVKTGLQYKINCNIFYSGMSYESTLVVIQRCSGTDTQCFYQLELPDGRASSIHPDAINTPWCDPLSFRGVQGRFKATGVLSEDTTLNFESQTELLYNRKLDDSDREPLQERYITSGEVPTYYDNRNDECFAKVVAYNQGQCNAGYASAWAGMMGARKCLSDKKSVVRRLRRLSENAHNETAQKRKLIEEEKSLCNDDPQWSAFGKGKMNCNYFATHGCNGDDYGQFTHCRLSCGTCPGASDEGNPWAGADYKYMPSVEDLASCSVMPTGQSTGCAGGNMWSIWDNYLAGSKRPLWISGSDCKPYTLKCWNEQQVVNNLNTGLCWTYKDYQLWHRPCSCIEEKLRPKELPKCDADAPPDACQFPVPPAAFVVRGISSGLSLEEASLNYQRHILESGPLYVAVSLGMSFFDWDWEKKKVYTGQDGLAGGTAMMILGWGGGGLANINLEHWIVRNSWGGVWNDKGACLWQRGVNLHGIENQAGVVMPTKDFVDWTPPICRLTSWSRKWATKGTLLTNYTLEIKVRCSEDCEGQTFFSSAGEANGGSSLGLQMDGTVKKFVGKKQEEVTVPIVSLHLRGYGRKDEIMWLAVQATDDALNNGQTSSVFTIPGIPGVTEIQEQIAADLKTTEYHWSDKVEMKKGGEASKPAVEWQTLNPTSKPSANWAPTTKQEKQDKVEAMMARIQEKKKAEPKDKKRKKDAKQVAETESKKLKVQKEDDAKKAKVQKEDDAKKAKARKKAELKETREENEDSAKKAKTERGQKAKDKGDAFAVAQNKHETTDKIDKAEKAGKVENTKNLGKHEVQDKKAEGKAKIQATKDEKQAKKQAVKESTQKEGGQKKEAAQKAKDRVSEVNEKQKATMQESVQKQKAAKESVQKIEDKTWQD